MLFGFNLQQIKTAFAFKRITEALARQFSLCRDMEYSGVDGTNCDDRSMELNFRYIYNYDIIYIILEDEVLMDLGLVSYCMQHF